MRPPTLVFLTEEFILIFSLSHTHTVSLVGPNTFDATVEYITQQFLDRNTDKVKKQVYVHMTTATDTSNVSFVFNAVKDIILQINLRGSGFI